MSSTLIPVDRLLRPNNFRAVMAACIGNLLECYDFIVYATFAVQISRIFFPTKNDFTSLMGSLLTFGVGFMARPLGAALFGAYADRAGRKAALTSTVLLMASGSFIIGVCPSAAKIGIAAPVILLIARLIQGFSAGGEVGSAITLTVEDAPTMSRAFYAAFQSGVQGAALVLCAVVALIITFLFTKNQVDTWAWRIPFLLGTLIAPVGFYIRRHIAEPDLFIKQRQKATNDSPIHLVYTKHFKKLLIGIGVVTIGTVGSYVALYIPTYAHQVLNISQSDAYFSLIIVGVIAMTSPVAGAVADRFSRKSVMLSSSVSLIIFTYPAFSYLTHHPDAATLIEVQIMLAILVSVYSGPATALLSELFPTAVRSSGTSSAYGLGVAIFGGFTPAIISGLATYTGNCLSIAFWLIFSATLSSVSLLTVKDQSRMELS